MVVSAKEGMIDKRKLREEYDSIADEFDKTRRKEWTQVKDFLDEVEKIDYVLDVGCGNGRHLKIVNTKYCLAVGIDFSKKLLSIAKRETNAVFVCGDASHLPFCSDLFDAVLFIATLHHIPEENERVLALKEIHRVLKHGGKMLLSVWSRDAPKFESLPPSVKDAVVSWGRKATIYYHIFDEAELLQISRLAGFTNIDVWKGGMNIWLKAEKK